MRRGKGTVVIAVAPERRPAGRSRRGTYQTPRPRKLTPEQAEELRRLAPSRSLRDLAAHFGVSHETVRKALREQERVRSYPSR
jgi:hypothetical protein